MNWLYVIILIAGIGFILYQIFLNSCLLYTSTRPRDLDVSRIPSSA